MKKGEKEGKEEGKRSKEVKGKRREGEGKQEAKRREEEGKEEGRRREGGGKEEGRRREGGGKEEGRRREGDGERWKEQERAGKSRKEQERRRQGCEEKEGGRRRHQSDAAEVVWQRSHGSRGTCGFVVRGIKALVLVRVFNVNGFAGGGHGAGNALANGQVNALGALSHHELQLVSLFVDAEQRGAVGGNEIAALLNDVASGCIGRENTIKEGKEGKEGRRRRPRIMRKKRQEK